MKTKHPSITDTVASVPPRPVGSPKGDPGAVSSLIVTNYPTLRRSASYYFRNERPGHLLEAAAVLNESFIRMTNRSAETWNSEAQVIRATSLEMRRVLVESARASAAVKRGGGMVRVRWDDAMVVRAETLAAPELILCVRQLVGRLKRLDPQLAHLITLHYFEGHTIKEIANDTNLSTATVKSKLTAARAWLRGHLEQSANQGAQQLQNAHSVNHTRAAECAHGDAAEPEFRLGMPRTLPRSFSKETPRGEEAHGTAA